MWTANIEEDTVSNRDWRRVIFTSQSLQVVLMSVPKKTGLGWEKHRVSDQFFRIEKGKAKFEIEDGDGKKITRYLIDGMVTVVSPIIFSLFFCPKF